MSTEERSPKVSHTDRSGTPEDTQLDWDRPTGSYLYAAASLHIGAQHTDTHLCPSIFARPFIDVMH